MARNKLITIAAAGLCLTTFTQCFTNKKNEGQRLYEANCQSCHMEDGSGLRGVIPPIAGADYLEKHRDELPCLIRHGMEGPVTVNGKEYNQAMPGVDLREDQITNLLNYIQTNFGNNNQRYTMPEVEQLLEACPPSRK
ncbi:c-type cytochrome [Pontibacter cellulosilyticus]|uniref:Cytochrome c n=1 Tax=Pontibacter cellulosilyticus TaxID=1720253 RepID=A0A923SMN4_9BACT|nr:cytochrome c [Pontibacter cellulosilyticus]MBC5992365.1 cytochrome c [Pontibacter cellulosilyticus]